MVDKKLSDLVVDSLSFIMKGKKTAIDGVKPLISKKIETSFIKNPQQLQTLDLKDPPPFISSKEPLKSLVNGDLKKKAPVDDLYEYRKKVEQCLKCSLSQTRTQVIFGEGKIDSILYIVGEAPGRDEDIKGVPFVGRSGQLLTKMLEAIAIDRKDIFITNIVKCRPPENRDPQLEEIQACSPHLKWQIGFGKPKYILTLGRFSTGYFLDDFKSSLKSLRVNTPQSPFYPHVKVLPTYHPAAVLRSPERWKPLVWEDLKKLSHLLLQDNFYNEEQKAHLQKNKVIE